MNIGPGDSMAGMARSSRRGQYVGPTIGFSITAAILASVFIVVWAIGAMGVTGPTIVRQWELSHVDRLNDSQIGYAQTIIDVGRDADLPDDAIIIALMTALQESSLRNLDHGDRDSLGQFQQRPSQGRGTPEEIQDPVWAAQSFYGVNPEGRNPGLVHIAGWESMTPNEAAQAVQRSGFPHAYGRWQPLAEEILSSYDSVTASE